MSKVSVIIPARNEGKFLQKTIDSLLEKSEGDIEVIAVLDGYNQDIIDDERVLVLINSNPLGMRACINRAANIASGDFLFKVDAHCAFQQGFDVKLASDCDYDWLMIPSRYSLDADTWWVQNNGKSRVDYHYLSCPMTDKNNDPGLHGRVWNERARNRKDDPGLSIDDEMSFQGSAWFMNKNYFIQHCGGMQEEGYGTFIQEPQELGLKVWLGGGRVVVNKNTFYLHLHKGKEHGRGYFISKGEMYRGSVYSTEYWMRNKWPKQTRAFSWLIEKFWPVPTWPENWEELVDDYFKTGHYA